jgi:hypothetical protein
MSNALAIAGVTAVLRDLLDTGMIDHAITDALGEGVTVSAVAPDTIDLTAPETGPRLNLFVYHATPNPGWRNADLPSRNAEGQRTSNPPLALDLHYLLTAYGRTDLQAEVLLGYGMELMHETGIISRDAIRTALNPPAPVDGSLLPSVYQALKATDLADQVETIKITPAVMDLDAISNLWSAIQSHYRPTAPYLVTVVLIQTRRPVRSPLPVLTRGPIDPVTGRERGVVTQTDLAPPVPTITAVAPPARQPSAQLGDSVTVTGFRLDGTNRAVQLRNTRLDVAEEVPADPGAAAGSLVFILPAQPADFPAGHYELSAVVLRPGESDRRTTNTLGLSVAPRVVTALPMTVPRDANGDVSITLDVEPEVRPTQAASLILGTREIPAQAFAAQTGALTFVIREADPGTSLARLRVDGIDSLLIDRTQTPPVFFDHRITVT